MKNDRGPYLFNSKIYNKKICLRRNNNKDIYLHKTLGNDGNQSTVNIDFKLE